MIYASLFSFYLMGNGAIRLVLFLHLTLVENYLRLKTLTLLPYS